MIDFSGWNFEPLLVACGKYYRISGTVRHPSLSWMFVYPSAWIVSLGNDALRVWTCNGYEDLPMASVDSIVIR